MSTRIVAIIAVRDEEAYLRRLLAHLYSQDVEACIINHGSSDATRAIAEEHLGGCVMRIVDMDYTALDLHAMLRTKERLAAEIGANWYIHQDADEILEPPQPHATLREGIDTADSLGYNLINFDEFVFVPTSEQDNFEYADYVEKMRYYYFFEPMPQRLIRCWKNNAEVNIADSAGHKIMVPDPKVYPESFVLRHYIFLSGRHGRQKYKLKRKYSDSGIARGWHGWRARFKDELLRLPDKEELCSISDRWDKANPRSRHLFINE